MALSVLIVDDESMVRTLLRLMLVRAGFEVLEAENGFNALQKIEKLTPDLVLLDVMMPEMDGFEVCEALRENPKTAHLPIIMLSANMNQSFIQRGLRVGATKYVTKPVPREMLLRHVSELLLWQTS